MRLCICAPLLLAACSADVGKEESSSSVQVVGQLENRTLNEASGLASSVRTAGVLWAINDDGPATIYALDHAGRDLGRVNVASARNRDWEDIAAFTYEGKPHLLIADIGDNLGKRDVVTLYVVAEPASDDAEAEIAWRVDFRYPDGARDAESVAVDSTSELIYILSKRDIPAVLYELPLRPDGEGGVIATRLGIVDSLPQPSVQDIADAASNFWYWQPTAMDFSPDDDVAVILTYRGAYRYSRYDDRSWFETLGATPQVTRLDGHLGAEAIALLPGEYAAFVTIEATHAPLLYLDVATDK